MMVENFKSRNNQQFASNHNGYDGFDGTEMMVTDANQVMMFDKLKEWADAGLYGFYGAGWQITKSRSRKAKSLCGSALPAPSAACKKNRHGPVLGDLHALLGRD